MKKNLAVFFIIFGLVYFSNLLGQHDEQNTTEPEETADQYPPPPFLLNWFKDNLDNHPLTDKHLTTLLQHESEYWGKIQLAVCDEKFSLEYSEHLSKRIGSEEGITIAYFLHQLKSDRVIDYDSKYWPFRVFVNGQEIHSLYTTNLIISAMGDPEAPKLIANHSPNGFLRGSRYWLIFFPKIKAKEVTEAILNVKSAEINLKKKTMKWKKNKTLHDYFMEE